MFLDYVLYYKFDDYNTDSHVFCTHPYTPTSLFNLILRHLKGRHYMISIRKHHVTFLPSASNFLAVAVQANRLIGSVVTLW